ncbi:MAG TPA: hypothetical protein VFS12_07415 [Terriglobia bacterium]|nr:hypothetical protein [Terriglobia bacterium]
MGQPNHRGKVLPMEDNPVLESKASPTTSSGCKDVDIEQQWWD